MRSRRVLNALIVRPLAWMLLRVRVTGLANVPCDDPFVLMVNHRNFLDPGVALIALLPREVTLFTKVENLGLPLIGLLLRWYGAIPVKRGTPDVEAIRKSIEVLTEKRAIVLVAPEGTRSYHGSLLPGKSGMAFLATRANVPVLPVAVTGVEVFWSNLRRIRRTQVCAVIGYPFRFRQAGHVHRDTLAEMTREAMYQLAALLPPERWGAYADMENATEEYIEFLEHGRSNLVFAGERAGGAKYGYRQPIGGAPE